jgi:phosphoribosyl 1,2-cyclic phosphodiesterase
VSETLQLAARGGADAPPVENLRIRFYGVQGSGSTFPAHSERESLLELRDVHLLRSVFEDLAHYAGEDGRLNCTPEEVLGGRLDRETLLRYRQKHRTAVPRSYGGWTTAIHVETGDGHDLVFDCGSGFRHCALALQQKWDERTERHLHLFGSHSHSDHTEGFDQAAVCFDPRNSLHVYGNAQFLRALDSYLGIFSRHVAEDVLGLQSPIFYAIMPARFEGIEIRPPPVRYGRVHDLSEPIEIGNTRVIPFEVYHPAPCLAYRVEHGGKSFVFCTDHELRHGSDRGDPRQLASEAAEERLRTHAHGADVLYRDGQYLRAEYEGAKGIGASAAVPRLDWGHSCIEDVEAMAVACEIAHTYIGHHDPNRDWSERNWIDETLARNNRSRDAQVELAQAETVIAL